MKKIHDKKTKSTILVPETPLEAVEELWEFFRNDMSYAYSEEWKNDKDMMKYINAHFKICADEIRNMRCKKCHKKLV